MMADLNKILKVIWIAVLIILWVCFPFFPGDIFFWMWLAIIWSIIGGVISTIFSMAESKKTERIVSIVWAIVLVILWFFYPFFPGEISGWMLFAIIWSIIGGILAIGVWIVRRTK